MTKTVEFAMLIFMEDAQVLMTIINDADAIMALVNEDDANHEKAVTISGILTEQKATVITPVTAIIEAITALKRAINRPDLAKVIVTACQSGNIPTIDVPADILPEAITFFNPDASKKDTM
ncbi:MAG: hypothetical protein ACREBJ_12970, partial [Nitrosotalea sp.]